MGGQTESVRFREIVYSPLPSQSRFHESTARFKGFSGPIGSGKSQALCQEAIRMTYVNPGRTGLLGAPTYPMLRDATQTSLFEILHGNRLPFEHNKSESTIVMKDSRSRILLRAVDEFERLRGTNLAWFGLDELTYSPEEAWLRLEGRLRDPKARRLCGFAVWTPKGFDWVYRKFVIGKIEGYEAVIAKPNENRYLLERTPDFYEQLARSYDAKFYRQEALGEYLNLTGGKVYSAFDPEANVADLKIDPNLPLYWANDFNVDPMCSLVAQVDGAVTKVVGEIFLRNATTHDACGEFLARYSGHRQPVYLVGDAAGYQRQTTGGSDYELIQEYFELNSSMRPVRKVPRNNPLVRERVNLTNARLRSACGEVKLVVDRSCQELIKDFQQVGYKQDTGAIDKDKDKLRTHLSDALGYLLLAISVQGGKAGERGDGAIC